MTRGAVAIATSLAVAFSGTPLASTQALAESAAELQAQANTLAGTVEQKRQEYQQAQAAVDQLQSQIADNEASIQEIQAQLPGERQKAAEAIRTLYKMQQNAPGLIDLLLSSDSFNDFISTLVYIDNVQQRNSAVVTDLANMQSELDTTQATLTAQKQQADEQAATAQQALEDTKKALADARAKAEQQAAAEEAERQAAIEAARKAQEEAAAKQAEGQKAEEEESQKDESKTADKTAEKADEGSSAKEDATETESDSGSGSSSASGTATFTTSSGNQATVEVPTAPAVDTSAAETNVTASDQQAWAARIDAYLAGSPLAGQGATFAAAAAQYGVDPRLSPAISCVESTKGAACFRPHNAWGWGSSGWSDWTSAINAHVSGLASGYADVMNGGYTLSVAMARRYCPPTYMEWYASVASEMEKI